MHQVAEEAGSDQEEVAEKADSDQEAPEKSDSDQEVAEKTDSDQERLRRRLFLKGRPWSRPTPAWSLCRRRLDLPSPR